MQRALIDFQGRQVSCQYSKTDSDTTIFFVHGAGNDSNIFTKQFHALKQRFNIIAVDLPGHGQSPSNGELTVETYRDAVLVIMHALEPGRAVLVGHSMGSGVIIEAYLARRELFAGLVFIAAGPALPVSPMIFDLIEKDFGTFISMADQTVCSPGADDELKSILSGSLETAGRDIVYGDFSIYSRYDYLPALSSITVPVLVAGNTGDRMVSIKGVKKLQQSIPSAKIVTYDAQGHVPQWEQADDFNRDLTDFIESLCEK